MIPTKRRGPGMLVVWDAKRRRSCWKEGGTGHSWSETVKLREAPLPAPLCECLYDNLFNLVSTIKMTKDAFVFPQGGRGRETLRDLQDAHRIRLRWALQLVLVAQGARPPLPPHVADPAQPAAECNPGLARSQPAVQLRHTSTPPWFPKLHSMSTDDTPPRWARWHHWNKTLDNIRAQGFPSLFPHRKMWLRHQPRFIIRLEQFFRRASRPICSNFCSKTQQLQIWLQLKVH